MRNTRGGNFLFWFGLILGCPMIIILYLRNDNPIDDIALILENKQRWTNILNLMIFCCVKIYEKF